MVGIACRLVAELPEDRLCDGKELAGLAEVFHLGLYLGVVPEVYVVVDTVHEVREGYDVLYDVIPVQFCNLGVFLEDVYGLYADIAVFIDVGLYGIKVVADAVKAVQVLTERILLEIELPAGENLLGVFLQLL